MNKLQRNNSFLGFTDNRTALQAGKIEKTLSKALVYDGVIMERRDAVLKDLFYGKVPLVVEEDVNGKKKKSYRLAFSMNGSNVYNEITKTEYDFCLYLIKNDFTSEERVDAYLKEEKEKIAIADREAEEARKMEEESLAKEEEENRKFVSWLEESAERYEGTAKGNIMKSIFIDKLGEFKNRNAAYEVLVCIDNIENARCKELLKRRLHIDNKASRKTFEQVTGLKLPKSLKGTYSFIDGLSKNDYKEVYEPVKNATKQETAEGSVLETFYILNKMQDDETKEVYYEYDPVLGEAITKKGFKCFIYMTDEGKYIVSLVECGMKIAEADTRRAAVRELKRSINKIGDVKLRRSIQAAVKEYGKIPA